MRRPAMPDASTDAVGCECTSVPLTRNRVLSGVTTIDSRLVPLADAVVFFTAGLSVHGTTAFTFAPSRLEIMYCPSCRTRKYVYFWVAPARFEPPTNNPYASGCAAGSTWLNDACTS